MTRPLVPDALDEAALLVDDPDFATAPWSLDELDRSTDLGSVRSAWASSSDFYD
jgi:hypothetical protein